MPSTSARKIIFVHLLNDFSGSPKVLSQVINAAQTNGIEVELFTGNKTEGFLTGLTDKHHFFIYKRFENKYLTLISFVLSQSILFIKLLRYWRKDVEIYVNTMLPFGAGLAGWFMRKRVIYHIHETCLTPAGFKSFLRRVIRLTSKKLIFVSQSVHNLENFENKYQVVVFNSIPEDFQKIGTLHNYSNKYSDKFNILMLSSMKAYKGVFEFFEIAKQLQMNEEVAFTLVLNANQTEIDIFFKSTAIPKNIKIYSQQSNVLPFYRNANLVLNLSRPDQWMETFGLTILEAMSFAIPVIVPPVGGPAEIVSDGIEGYLISSYETTQIAQKIEELYNNPEKCMELSSNAKKRALDFNEQKFNQAILDVLQS